MIEECHALTSHISSIHLAYFFFIAGLSFLITYIRFSLFFNSYLTNPYFLSFNVTFVRYAVLRNRTSVHLAVTTVQVLL